MEEDIFFKVGISTNYLEETRKVKRTSKCLKIIEEHKFIVSLFVIVIMCSILNFWLIYSFLDLLSQQF